MTITYLAYILESGELYSNKHKLLSTYCYKITHVVGFKICKIKFLKICQVSVSLKHGALGITSALDRSPVHYF